MDNNTAPKQENVQNAINALVFRMTELKNNTFQTYLWKWYPDCHGLHGKNLPKYLMERGVQWGQVVTEIDKISGKNTIEFYFVDPATGTKKAAELTFRAVRGTESDRDVNLEFGHKEIPFPEGVTISKS